MFVFNSIEFSTEIFHSQFWSLNCSVRLLLCKQKASQSGRQSYATCFKNLHVFLNLHNVPQRSMRHNEEQYSTAVGLGW